MGGNDGGNTVPPPLPKKMNKVIFCPCKMRYYYYYTYESIGDEINETTPLRNNE